MKSLFESITFGPMTIFLIVLFFALLNVGLFLIAEKHGAVKFYELHRRKWMPNKCEFCVFFWMSLIELFVTALTNHSADMLTFMFALPLAICAAVISRFFLRGS